MPLYQKGELLSFLNSLGTEAKKGLSQNFLIDGNILKKIIAIASIKEGESVLEVGPGPGVLTEALIENGAHVVAVEKDPIFAKALSRFPVKVIEGDILEVNLEEVLPKRNKVVANLPYHLTTPILEHLFSSHERFSELTLMVQREVGERIVAKPGSKIYGALSVFAQFYTEPQLAFIVKGNSFFPPPRVDSAIVHLKIRKSIPDVDQKKFEVFVKALFSFRRKMIRSSLKRICGNAVLGEIDGSRRAEELSLEELLQLFRASKAPGDTEQK